MEEAPWVTFDLFAYRVGVTDDLEGGLRSLLDQYRADMDAAVEQSTYAGWEELGRHSFEAEGHPLVRTGVRLKLQVRRDDSVGGSLTYLFYKPPFALKVRASYPARDDEATEPALDAAVRRLIPAVEAIAERDCQGQSVELSLPEDSDEMSDGQREQVRLQAFSEAALHHALRGCADLEGLLWTGPASRVASPNRLLKGAVPTGIITLCPRAATPQQAIWAATLRDAT